MEKGNDIGDIFFMILELETIYVGILYFIYLCTYMFFTETRFNNTADCSTTKYIGYIAIETIYR